MKCYKIKNFAFENFIKSLKLIILVIIRKIIKIIHMNFAHPLMFNNINSDDRKAVINFLKRNERLTQSYNVEKFEKKWSKWLGVKYSVFVNSGSSANLLTISAIKILYNPKEIIVPTLTWSSDIASLLHNNIKPKFVDIKLSNLAMDEEQIYKSITKDTKAVFITHAQGFNGLSQKLINTLKKKKIILIEDVCESHCHI